MVKRVGMALVAAVVLLGLVVPAAAAALAPAQRGAAGGATRFLVRPEGRVAYEEVGAGPLVVLVPGIGDTRAQYRFLAPELAAAGYRVVTMDLRGLGESSTGFSDYSAAAVGSDVVALLRELDAGPARLVGQSMAAGAVAWAAAEAPDRVESLVLIGPFVRDIPPTSWLQGALMGAMVNGLRAAALGRVRLGQLLRQPLPEREAGRLADYVAALHANLAERGRLEALRAMLNASKGDVDARLDQVRARTLVVMGSKDPDFDGFVGGPAGEAHVVADRLRGTVLMVEGAGHYPHVEMPALVNPAIVRFVGGQACLALPRRGLDRAAVVEAAVALADAEGLEGVDVRPPRRDARRARAVALQPRGGARRTAARDGRARPARAGPAARPGRDRPLRRRRPGRPGRRLPRLRARPPGPLRGRPARAGAGPTRSGTPSAPRWSGSSSRSWPATD